MRIKGLTNQIIYFTYWNRDRSNLDRCWIKLNGEKITLSKTRLERVKKFNNKNINKIAQGVTNGSLIIKLLYINKQ